jgi:hypothetical protein
MINRATVDDKGVWRSGAEQFQLKDSSGHQEVEELGSEQAELQIHTL